VGCHCDAVSLLFCVEIFKNPGCSVLCRLAVAILACFTARRWRLAVPLLQAGAWRQSWRGQAVAPVFASFFDFHVIVAWVVRHQCYNGFCI